MSLGIIIKAPEGIVLAAESRVTLSAPTGNGNEMLHVNFDNANKLLTFNSPYDNVGVVTYGQAAIGIRTAQSFVPEFENRLQQNGNVLTVLQFAQALSDFFMEQWNLVMPAPYAGPNMIFNVAGYDTNEPYGIVYNFEIPAKPNPVEQSAKVNNQHQFGITWGGQREIVDRLILGYDTRLLNLLTQAGVDPQAIPQIVLSLRVLQLAMPIQFMPLQDCIHLAVLFIKTTINTQNLTVGLRGCGGAIDVAIITRNKPLQFIQQKNIFAEQ